MIAPVALLVAEVAFGLLLLRWLLARRPLPVRSPPAETDASDPLRVGPFR